MSYVLESEVMLTFGPPSKEPNSLNSASALAFFTFACGVLYLCSLIDVFKLSDVVALVLRLFMRGI